MGAIAILDEKSVDFVAIEEALGLQLLRMKEMLLDSWNVKGVVERDVAMFLERQFDGAESGGSVGTLSKTNEHVGYADVVYSSEVLGEV